MEIFSAKIVPMHVSNGDGIIAILNAEQAAQYGITQHDKISLIRKGEEYVVDVALSSEYIDPGTIGATSELLENYPIMP